LLFLATAWLAHNVRYDFASPTKSERFLERYAISPGLPATVSRTPSRKSEAACRDRLLARHGAPVSLRPNEIPAHPLSDDAAKAQIEGRRQVQPDAGHESLAKHGRSFWWAGQLMRKDMLDNAADVYAFCRAVDNLADLSRDQQRLTAMKLALAGDPAKVRGDTREAVERLLQLSRSIDFNLGAAEMLIDSVSADIEFVQPKDEAALLDYAFGVAGTVGVMMVAVLDIAPARRKAALPFAIDLGVAMQLTNIARDLLDDAKMMRTYLPLTWVGSTETRQFAWRVSADDQLARKIAYGALPRLLALADRYYQSAETGMTYIPWRARWAILTASRVYRAIGEKAARRGDVKYWSSRTVVSNAEKAWRTAWATCALMASFFRAREPAHDATLHEPFATRLRQLLTIGKSGA
jgi:15-cis-phytoene synthase